jgi:lipopolysaccharide/colanic/teichoic acid biosynthesis glycosyltransferase
MTCIWQVSGRSEVDWDDWIELDLEYIRTWSLLLDVKLLLLTIPAVLSGRGAY